MAVRTFLDGRAEGVTWEGPPETRVRKRHSVGATVISQRFPFVHDNLHARHEILHRLPEGPRCGQLFR